MKHTIPKTSPPLDAGKQQRRHLLIIALLSFSLKLLLMATTYGTNDVQTFDSMLDRLNLKGSAALYQMGIEIEFGGQNLGVSQMNHPPLVLTFARVGGWLRSVTGISVGFWIRFACALADLFTLLLLYRLYGMERDHRLSLLLVAAAPAAIMISGFHGNTDPIMICFVVLAAYCMEKKTPVSFAGAAFALACSIKVWPLVLAPAFLFAAGTARKRVAFCLSGLVVGLFLALPWVTDSPLLILNRVFAYGSIPGWWGLSIFQKVAHPALQTVLFGSLLATAAYMHQRVSSVFAQCAILTFLFLFLTPGFGPQYLAWAVPFTVAAGWRPAALFHLLSGVFLFSMYSYWSRGFPWSFANAHVNAIHPWVFWFGLSAWALCAVFTVLIYRGHYRPIGPFPPLTRTAGTSSGR